MEAWLGLLFLAIILCAVFGGDGFLCKTIEVLFSLSLVLWLLLGVIGYGANRFAFTRRVRFANPGPSATPPRRLRLIGTGRGRRQKRYRSGQRREGHLGAWLKVRSLQVLTILVIPVGLGLVVLGIELDSDWISMVLVFGPLLGGVGVFWWLVKKSQIMKRNWMRYRIADADEALTQDERSPVLLLRSFREEGRQADSLTGDDDVPVRFEEVLVSRLARHGPVIAIGQPDEPLPPLGASREYVSEDWQGRVTELIDSAQMTVAVMDSSAGLLWEFGQVFDRGRQERLMIVVPDVDDEKLALRWQALVEVEGVDPKLASIDLDDTWSENLALVFDSAGNVHRIVGRLRLAEYYHDAVEYAAWFIQQQSLPD